jgi:hypothetical protein
VYIRYQGVAIGGDRYPGTRFIDHLQRYNDDPNVKMLVLLGEVRYSQTDILPHCIVMHRYGSGSECQEAHAVLLLCRIACSQAHAPSLLRLSVQLLRYTQCVHMYAQLLFCS